MPQQAIDYQTPPRAKATSHIMGALALILSVVGLLLLLVVADLRWGFVRLPVAGLESGFIVGFLAWVSGVAVSAAAALLAFLQWRRAGGGRSWQWLLAWCCVLVLGFGVVLCLMSSP